MNELITGILDQVVLATAALDNDDLERAAIHAQLASALSTIVSSNTGAVSPRVADLWFGQLGQLNELLTAAHVTAREREALAMVESPEPPAVPDRAAEREARRRAGPPSGRSRPVT